MLKCVEYREPTNKNINNKNAAKPKTSEKLRWFKKRLCTGVNFCQIPIIFVIIITSFSSPVIWNVGGSFQIFSISD